MSPFIIGLCLTLSVFLNYYYYYSIFMEMPQFPWFSHTGLHSVSQNLPCWPWRLPSSCSCLVLYQASSEQPRPKAHILLSHTANVAPSIIHPLAHFTFCPILNTPTSDLFIYLHPHLFTDFLLCLIFGLWYLEQCLLIGRDHFCGLIEWMKEKN